jgi:hypothetical protein
MPDSVKMRIGETQQLRAPAGEIEHWVSGHPEIADVTDEDLTFGHAGGLVSALREGRTTIKALGFDQKVLIEINVVVKAIPPIRVAAEGTAALPEIRGVSEWTVENSRVARISGDSICGISPGVTRINGSVENISSIQCIVEVAGTLDVEIDQTRSLNEFFSIPVRSWKSSVQEVRVDSQGTVTTGSRPRTVEISAQLENGEIFTFDLRIIRPTPALAPPQSPNGFPPPPSSLPSPPDQVEQQLNLAKQHIEKGNWAQAGAELTAARVAAGTDEELRQRVDREREDLRRIIVEGTGKIFAHATQAIAEGCYDMARSQIEADSIPSFAQTLKNHFLLFVDEVEKNTRESCLEKNVAKVTEYIVDIWEESVRIRIFNNLPSLAEIGLQFGDEILIPLIHTLSDPDLAEVPLCIRQSLEEILASTGKVGLELLMIRLLDSTTSKEQGKRLVNLIPGLKPRKYVSVFIRQYARSDHQEQAKIVIWLCELHMNTADTLLDIVAGILSQLPLEDKLAYAIQKQVGITELRKTAQTWAVGGHKGAQTVLDRLYS